MSHKTPEHIENLCLKMYNDGEDVSHILDKLGISRALLGNIRKRNGCGTRRIGLHKKVHFPNEEYFDDLNDPQKAYWVGFIAADGSIDKKNHCLSLALARKDREVLERLALDLGISAIAIQDRFNSAKGKKYPISKLAIGSKKICLTLGKYGIVNKKSLTFSPTNIPPKMTPYFILGYFDGDGFVGKEFNRVDICCSEKMADWLQKVFLSIGIESKIRLHGKIFYCSFSCLENMLKLEQYLYQQEDMFFLQRKRKVFANKNRKTVKQILREQIAEILEKKKEGLTYQQIADSMNIACNRVHHLIKYNNKHYDKKHPSISVKD